MAQQVPAPQAEEQRREQLRQLLSNRLPQEEMAALLSTDVDLLLAQNLVTDSRIRGASKEDLVHAGFTIGTAVALKNAFPDPHGMCVDWVPWHYTAYLQEGKGRGEGEGQSRCLLR